MPTVVTAPRTTHQYNDANILIRDVSSELYKINPDAGPFQTFTRALNRKKEAKSTKVEFQSIELVPTVDAVNNVAGYLAGDTEIKVDNPTYFKAGSVVLVPRTGEQMLVNEVGADHIHVVGGRAWGVTGAAALLDNDVLLILGSAYAERSGAAAVKSTQIVTDYNYTQIFKTAMGLSSTARAVTAAGGTYGGNDILLNKELRSIEHLRSIELQMLFGERKEDWGTDDPIRAMGGINEFITENLKDIGGNLTESVFKAWIRELFKEAQGSDTRVLLCDPLFCDAVSHWAQAKAQTNVETKKFGMAVTEYFTNFGKLVLKPHWMLTEEYGQDGIAFAVDFKYIQYRPLVTRDTQLQMNVQEVGTDQQIDQLLTECTLEVSGSRVHGKAYGMTSYS